MRLADLVVFDCEGRDTHPPAPAGNGAFTAVQTLVAFPLGTSIVATIARASHTIGRTEFDSVTVPLAASFAVGFALFAVTVRDPRSRPRGARAWICTSITAFANSLVLFAAALGIEKF